MKFVQRIATDIQLDCQGLACPMPIVRTKKAIEQMQAGQVIEVSATDKGSLADIQSWSQKVGHQYLGTLQQADILYHYLRKSDEVNKQNEQQYPHTLTLEQFQQKYNQNTSAEGSPFVIVDVREPAEYIFNHIPGAISMPLGELSNRINELDPNKDIAVICRTGTRSDLACCLLAEQGFKSIYNVIPGMIAWDGLIEGSVHDE